MTEDDLTALARRLGRLCKRRRVVLAVAESCTGGGLAEAITRISGSSAWFDRGLVTYSNDAKRELLGVRSLTLERHGAVSEEVAREMAAGVLKRTPADASVSITGVAGPTGGSRAKPVGLVWIAWARRGARVTARRFDFRGNRLAIRTESVSAAIQGLIDLLR